MRHEGERKYKLKHLKTILTSKWHDQNMRGFSKWREGAAKKTVVDIYYVRGQQYISGVTTKIKTGAI